MNDAHPLLAPIIKLHTRIRAAVIDACERKTIEQMARVVHDDQGDTIFAIDKISEDLLIDFFEREVAHTTPLVLIAEGLPHGQVILPRGSSETDAVWRIIIDPIDGTRGLMYQKRSGWILTGVARNQGPATNLQNIELAVQTEIPLVKQHLSDTVWAIRGRGVGAERFNRISRERKPLRLNPSAAPTIAQGCAMLVRFFPGGRQEMAAIDEEIIEGALGQIRPGKAHCFEDQYICTGGQLYELMAGHDRFVADLRPLLEPLLAQRGQSLGLCCHPYDLCTELIARELGVIICDPAGHSLQAPLNVSTNVAWAGYANPHIRAQIEPLMQAALKKRGLLCQPIPLC